MIKSKNECKVEVRENMRGGDGSIEICHLVTEDDLYNKGRLFATITLKSGCSIGKHTHEQDSEIFHILTGTALYDDNGTEKTVGAGDVLICKKGESHSIKNTGDSDVVLTALIVYA